jgi:Holliday junction resolvasome RuvABC endonuclease subunit
MILSLDISSSCVGYCVFNNDGKLLKMSCAKFNSKQSKFERLQIFIEELKREKITEMPIEMIAIEEPLKKFKGKFSSAETISILNFFNGLVSAYLYITFGIEPVYYNVNSARSTVFPKKTKKEAAETLDSEEVSEEGTKGEVSIKHEIWKKVMKLEPQINWRYSTRTRKLMDENYDMSDSYVIGACHLIMIDKQLSTQVN